MKTNIVAAVDMSTSTPVVIEVAAKETKLRAGATLHLLYVLPPPAVPVGAISAPVLDLTGEMEAAREELERAGRGVDLDDGHPIIGHVRIGSAPDEIIALAKDVDADLIVLGESHKGLVMRTLAGSTTEPLLHQAPCSVLIARPYEVPEIEPPRPDHTRTSRFASRSSE